jgi:hypothetical protein
MTDVTAASATYSAVTSVPAARAVDPPVSRSSRPARR